MLWRMVYRSLFKSARASGWTLAALATCAALVTLFVSMQQDLSQKLGSDLRRQGANAVAHLTDEARAKGAAGEAGAAATWRAVAETARARGATLAKVSLRVGSVAAQPVAVASADPAALEAMTPYWRVTGRRPRSQHECLVGARAAKALKLDVGVDALVQWPDTAGYAKLHVVGVSESGDEDDDRLYVTAFVSTSAEQLRNELPGALPVGHPPIPGRTAGAVVDCRTCHAQPPSPGNLPELSASSPFDAPPIAPSPSASTPVSPPPAPAGASPRVPVRASPPTAAADVRPTAAFTYALLSVPDGEAGIEQLQAAIQARDLPIEIKPLRQIVYGERVILGKINLLSALTLTVVVVLTSVGVSASVAARTVERRSELALLEALGARRRAVARFLLAEISVLGLAASVGGFVIGTLLAAVVVRRIFAVTIAPHAMALVVTVVVTTGVALVGGLVAARRLGRIQPAIALRGE